MYRNWKRGRKKAEVKFLEFYSKLEALFKEYEATDLLNFLFKKEKYFTDVGFEIWGKEANGKVNLLSKIATFMLDEEITYLNWVEASAIETSVINSKDLGEALSREIREIEEEGDPKLVETYVPEQPALKRGHKIES